MVHTQTAISVAAGPGSQNYVLLGNYLHAGYLLLYCYCKVGNSEIVCIFCGSAVMRLIY
jgi:hypothetical protein